MPYATYDKVASAWVKKVLDQSDKAVPYNMRMPVSVGGDAIFSYGTHFPISLLLRGRTGKPKLFLLNGDTFSPSTGRHQATVRSHIQKQDKVPSVIVPFSVMVEARIDRMTVQLIDATKDEVEYVPTRDRNGEWYLRPIHRLGESLIRAQVLEFGRRHKRGDMPRRRWAYFLSGWDRQETVRSYFFCELPPGVRPKTVAEAYQALKPQAVVYAESIGREVKRQGDIFAIPTTLTKNDITLAPVRRMQRMLGTNHVATEVLEYGGETFARGTLWHKPFGRQPDHKRVTIGKAWHLIKKNTVPIG